MNLLQSQPLEDLPVRRRSTSERLHALTEDQETGEGGPHLYSLPRRGEGTPPQLSNPPTPRQTTPNNRTKTREGAELIVSQIFYIDDNSLDDSIKIQCNI